jgi:arabinogalactan oligomer / maltooligosaccharide transport system substrate-binding protein
VLVILAAVAMVVAACDSDGGESTTTEAAVTETTVAGTEAPGTTATTGTTAAAAGDNLTLWVYDDGRIEILTQLGEEFAEENGVGVTVEAVDLAELRNQMLLGAEGNGPDLAIIPHDNLGALVENGAVAPVDLGDKTGEYLEQSLVGFTYDGELFGVPLAIENIGFFYNTDVVDTPPATWDEVAEVGAQLVDSGAVDVAIGLPDLTYNSYPVYTSSGGYVFGQDADGSFSADDIGLNNEGMVAGLTWVQGLVEAGLVPENVDWEASHVQFETGRGAFILTGPWAINRFVDNGVPYAIAPFPAAEAGGESGYPFLGVQGLIVNANSDQLLLAQTFATEKIATEESMAAIFEAEPRPSAWTSVFELADDADTQAFNAAGAGAIPMPSIPEMGFVWDAWVNAGTLVMTGELEPQAALDQAVEQIQAQIEEAG